MARDLTISEHNELILRDSVSGSDIVFYYRTPETPDRVKYQAGRFRRDGARMVMRFRSAAIEAAASVLVGIRDGDFTCGRDDEGLPIPISSNPDSLHYREDWKDLILQMAGDLLFIMGHELFEGQVDKTFLKSVQFVDENQEDAAEQPADGEGGEEIPPLATSSGD